MWSKHRLLLCACLLLATLVSGHDTGRTLLNTKKKEKEQTREDDALEAYFIKQATLNKEQERMLLFASEEAVTLVKKIDKSSRKKQVHIMADLWENAKGVTIVKTLALLVDLTPKKRIYYFGVNSDAMSRAESNGYSFKVSEAVYNALAITDPGNDHYHLLDALLYRMEQKEKASKGSGCQYIEFLFTDAEAWAIDDGRAQQFFRGFDNKDYLPLTECFLEECKGTAAKCCQSKKAVSSGLCGCKIVDKKKKTMQCAHNLFWTAPRVIWLCSTQDCDPDQKCICADPKAKKKKSEKEGKSGSTKGKGKGKDEEDDEPKKGKGKGKGKDEEDDEPKKGKGKDKDKDSKDKSDKSSKDSKGKSEKSSKQSKDKKDSKGKSEKDVEKSSKSKGKSEKDVKKTSKSKDKSEKDDEKSSKSKSTSHKSDKSDKVEKSSKSKGKSEKDVKKSSKSRSHSKTVKDSSKTRSKSSSKSHSKTSFKTSTKVKGAKASKSFTSPKKTRKTEYDRTRRET